MAEPTFCAGLEELAGAYDGLIVDQWGVLHDGSRVFPAALDALTRLKAVGKRIVLLSNSGRRLAFNLGRLDAVGIPRVLVEGVVTSGETCWDSLRRRDEPFFAALGRRCILWSEGHDRGVLDGLELDEVEDAAEADFLLLAGIPDGARPADLEPVLEQAAAGDLPMICCNPDRIVGVASGISPAPGAVAERYEHHGGRVHYVGKPHPAVYQACLERHLQGLPRSRILAVGDSLEHDIAGAVAMGLDAALVMGGIHKSRFDLSARPEVNRPALAQLLGEQAVRPRYVLPAFTWRPEQA